MSRSSLVSLAAQPRAERLAQQAASLLETTKPRITRLVTITAAVGFAMAALGRTWALAELLIAVLGCIVGTAMSAAGANALNQLMERHRDARMPRTVGRPLPQDRVEPRAVLLTGSALCVLGVVTLWATCGPVPAAISAICVLTYLALYTPMKVVSIWSTLVGAIPGALPPLIGWTAASQATGWAAGWAAALEPGGVSLFLLMTVWQLPHFLAIAWLYREDYAAGGYRMLPVIDPRGVATAPAIVLTAFALIPLTLLPAYAMPELLGFAYLSVAWATGIVYLALAVRLAITRTRRDARAVFIASIVHLPLLLIVMVAEAFVRVLILN